MFSTVGCHHWKWRGLTIRILMPAICVVIVTQESHSSLGRVKQAATTTYSVGMIIFSIVGG